MGGTVARCRVWRDCARCSLYEDRLGDRSHSGGMDGHHGMMVAGQIRSRRDEGVDLERMDPEVRDCSSQDRREDGMVEVRGCGRTWREELMVVLRVNLCMRSLVHSEGHDSHFGNYHLEVRALESRNHLAGLRYGIRLCSTHLSRTVLEIGDEEAGNAGGMVLVHARAEVRREEESKRVEAVTARDSQENERLVERESYDMPENVYQTQSPQPVYPDEFVALNDEMRLGTQCETHAQPYVQGIASALGDDGCSLVDT